MNRGRSENKESPVDNNGTPDVKGAWNFEYLGYRLDFRSGVSVSMKSKATGEIQEQGIRLLPRRYESQRSKITKWPIDCS